MKKEGKSSRVVVEWKKTNQLLFHLYQLTINKLDIQMENIG